MSHSVHMLLLQSNGAENGICWLSQGLFGSFGQEEYERFGIVQTTV